MLVTYSGIALTYLVTIRYFTNAYIRIAEETNWAAWLKNATGDDIVIGARFGDEIIATVVLRLQRNAKSDSGRAYIRAWTTKLRFRGRGLGGDMLSEAVKVSRQTLGNDCAVEFAGDHANSHVILRPFLSDLFSRDRQRAFKALDARNTNR